MLPIVLNFSGYNNKINIKDSIDSTIKIGEEKLLIMAIEHNLYYSWIKALNPDMIVFITEKDWGASVIKVFF